MRSVIKLKIVRTFNVAYFEQLPLHSLSNFIFTGKMEWGGGGAEVANVIFSSLHEYKDAYRKVMNG